MPVAVHSACFINTLQSLAFWLCTPFCGGKLSVPWYPEVLNKPVSFLVFGAALLD